MSQAQASKLSQDNPNTDQLGLIKLLLVVLTTAGLIGAIVSLVQLITTDFKSSVVLLCGSIFICIVSIISFGLAKRSPRTAIYIVVLTVLLGSTLFQLSVQSASLASSFILVPVLAGILGLSNNETITSAVLGGILLVLAFVGKNLLYDPNYSLLEIFDWLIIYTLVAIGIIVFTRRIKMSSFLLSSKNERLGTLLIAFDTTTASGFSLSRELSGVTTELDIASHQQATGTQEQVAAITQVTSSLEELNESANRIAQNAILVVESANQAVATATEVKHASQLSQTTASKGYEAVEQAINSAQRMRDNIEQMASRLLRLTEQTNNVGKIVDLINGIAEETHLLSLNASIEAAGSLGGQGQGRGGERFGVIALEVKNLADRSKDATKEIRETIGEMQNAVAAAVLTAEEGRKETFAAVGRSQLSGEVIHTLTEVISNSYRQADQILEVAYRVKTRCEEISLATNQQRSANQQILATMREIGRISFENAGAVSQLAGMAVRVSNQVVQLNTILQTTGQAKQTANVP